MLSSTDATTDVRRGPDRDVPVDRTLTADLGLVQQEVTIDVSTPPADLGALLECDTALTVSADSSTWASVPTEIER